MRVGYGLSAACLGTILTSVPAFSEDVLDSASKLTKTLLLLCMASGSETYIATDGAVELNANIKDILAGKFGVDTKGKVKLTKEEWQAVIGGISKDTTATEGQQLSEARKCLIENGYPLIRALVEKRQPS